MTTETTTRKSTRGGFPWVLTVVCAVLLAVLLKFWLNVFLIRPLHIATLKPVIRLKQVLNFLLVLMK